MQAAKKLNQTYTFVTMDLAAANIAFDIKFGDAERFSPVIIHLGAFHIMCSYMEALRKMMTGSGFEDILIEAGVCASGSIDKIMSGKHFNQAMRIHQHMLDELERICLDEFVCSSTAPDSSIPDVILENISTLAACPSLVNIMDFEFTNVSNQFIQMY